MHEAKNRMTQQAEADKSMGAREPTFGEVALLAVQGRLLGLAEVGLRHLHAPLAQRKQTGLGANGLQRATPQRR